MASLTSFSGSVPANYDKYLGPSFLSHTHHWFVLAINEEVKICTGMKVSLGSLPCVIEIFITHL